MRRNGQLLPWLWCAVAAISSLATAQEVATSPQYKAIPAGSFVSTLSNLPDNAPVAIAAFSLRTKPVSNGDFLAFVTAHPEWRRDQIPASFADPSYLHDWHDALTPDKSFSLPVTSVSWFAADAYCASEQARLPSWYEWEYVAAADQTHADARRDPVWRERILEWYGSTNSTKSSGAANLANFYGIQTMHGTVWEWVDDFNSLMISADSRNQGDPDKLKFCGAGAISLQDKENYAVLMRIALLSSLQAADTTNNLGFRCARNSESGKK